MWPPWEIRWPDIRGAPLRLRCAVVDVLEWLLDSDPAVRWQVKRDLLGAPAEEEVLSGLLEYERATGGSPRVHDVRLRGQEYLLERRMRRRLSNGEVIDPEWDLFSFPTYWHYDVLRGLDFLRSAGAGPDPRVAEAKAGSRYLFFMDAAHFVFGTYLGYLWGFVQILVQTPSGRQRFNVLGALNAITREIVTVTNTGYINSHSVVPTISRSRRSRSNSGVGPSS